jgi:tetratricopeptide (TPR) repeat protein
LLLEAARYNASVGQAANAVALYQSYLSMRPATGLSLELTRTALAAQRPELAVEWAEAGLAGGDRGSDLQYAYAQALHLSDRPAAAAAILQKLLVGDPHNGDWLLWLAYTAQARGRSVEAYELLRAAIDAGTTPAGNLWLTRGDVAAQWGDVLRAKKDYERARSSGADPEAVSSREQKLSDQLSPQIAVPGEVLGDSNGVEFAQGAVTFFLQPTASGRFSGTWASGQISQRGYGFSTRAARVDMDDAFVSTRLQLRAGGGVQQNADETLATWHGGGTYRFARGGSLAADAIRDTPWSRQLEANPLRFNRVIDLAALGPGFHFTKWKGRADVPLTSVDSVFAEASFSRYSDANGESELYLQYQRAKSLSRSWWAAVQPNLYLDRWSEHRTEYFSPLQHTTVGVTLKSIVERARWLVDASATPQMLQSNGQRGFGLTFATAARVNLGGVSVGGSVMLFDDRRYNYDLHRFTLDLRVPLSK